jgi:NADH pyrophosphatase NudC (nudix superfamily)
MATKKRMVGPFKIEEIKSEMIALENGMRMHIVRNARDKARIDNVRIQNGGVEVSIGAAQLAQAAMVLKSIDESKRFVCGNHGTFESNGDQRQSAVCPHCHEITLAAARVAVDNRSVALDEEDA